MRKLIISWFGVIFICFQTYAQQLVSTDDDCSMLADNLSKCQSYGCTKHDNELIGVLAVYAVIGESQSNDKNQDDLHCRVMSWYELQNAVVYTDGVYDKRGIQSMTEILRDTQYMRKIHDKNLYNEIDERMSLLGDDITIIQEDGVIKSQEELNTEYDEEESKMLHEAPRFLINKTQIEKIQNTDIYHAITRKLLAVTVDFGVRWDENTIDSFAKNAQDLSRNFSTLNFLDNLHICNPYNVMYRGEEFNARYVIREKNDDECHYEYITQDFTVNCKFLDEDIARIEDFFAYDPDFEDEYLLSDISDEEDYFTQEIDELHLDMEGDALAMESIVPEVVKLMFGVGKLMLEIGKVASDMKKIAPEMDETLPNMEDIVLEVEDIAPEVDKTETLPNMEDIVPEVDDAETLPNMEDIVPEVGKAETLPNIVPEVEDIVSEMDDALPDMAYIVPEMDDALLDTAYILPEMDDALPDMEDIVHDVTSFTFEGHEDMFSMNEGNVNKRKTRMIMKKVTQTEFKELLLSLKSCVLDTTSTSSSDIKDIMLEQSTVFTGSILIDRITIEKIRRAMLNFARYNKGVNSLGGRKEGFVDYESTTKNTQKKYAPKFQYNTKEFVLGAIIYLSEDSWALWINDKKISSKDSRQVEDFLRISDVQYNAVSFVMPYTDDMARMIKNARDKTKKKPDIVVLEDIGLVKVVLYSNQKFNLSTMNISEVGSYIKEDHGSSEYNEEYYGSSEYMESINGAYFDQEIIYDDTDKYEGYIQKKSMLDYPSDEQEFVGE